jgi:prepilin-type N-terminal cleavage/methylation domain-containing protein
MNRSDNLHIRPSPSRGGSSVRLPKHAFTLVELLVVIIIISILSALTLGGLTNARKSSRTQTTTLMIRGLNDAIMSQYEVYEDAAIAVTDIAGLVKLRLKMREELPDAWDDVGAITPTGSSGRAYVTYKNRWSSLSTQYQSAECLYMIITTSGFVSDFLENIRPDRVGDIDGDGAKEFLDGWGNPIAFTRWAPGFSSPLSPIQYSDSVAYHDPIDVNGLDSKAFALYPLIYSPGVDGEYGLLQAKTGWPYDATKAPDDPSQPSLGTVVGKSPCTFNPDNKGLIGAPDPDGVTNYRDNITNHALIAQ